MVLPGVAYPASSRNWGHCVVFPGSCRHGGHPITSGVRYIVAAFLWVEGFEPPPYSQTIPLSFDPEPPQDVRKLSEQFSTMNDENEDLGPARRDERGLYFNACSTLDKYRRRRRRREEEADRRIDPSLDATLDPEADDDNGL